MRLGLSHLALICCWGGSHRAALLYRAGFALILAKHFTLNLAFHMEACTLNWFAHFACWVHIHTSDLWNTSSIVLSIQVGHQGSLKKNLRRKQSQSNFDLTVPQMLLYIERKWRSLPGISTSNTHTKNNSQCY